MQSRDLLLYAYEQIQGTLRRAVDGLPADRLSTRVGPASNTIGWLAWHLLRVQDDHVAEVAGTEQVWTAGGWAARFDLPFEASATGYGFSADDVAAVRVDSADLLLGYAAAVHEQTARFLRGLSVSETAELLGRNDGAVRALQYRALRTLAGLLPREAAA